MDKDSLIIRNARIVNEGTVVEGDVLIRDGRIEQVGGAPDAADVEIAQSVEAGQLALHHRLEETHDGVPLALGLLAVLHQAREGVGLEDELEKAMAGLAQD